MSHELHEALSNFDYMNRLAGRARRWKRAATYERRSARFWHKHYLVLRERYHDLQHTAERRRQTAAWLARQLAAERSRRRDIVTKLITMYMAVLPHREYVSPEQALAVLEQEWRALVIRAETSARSSETSEGEQ